MNKELFDEIETLDKCLDWMEVFFKNNLCKFGCDKCLLNHRTEQFPHNHCKFYKFVDDIAYLEDHIEKYLGTKESEKEND